MFSFKPAVKTLLGISSLCVCLASVSAVSAQSTSGPMCGLVVQERADSLVGLFNPRNGDVNADGHRTLTDAIVILEYVLLGTQEIREVTCWLNPYLRGGDCQGALASDFEPYGYHPVTGAQVVLRNGDVNGDGAVDITDALVLAEWIVSDSSIRIVEFAGARLKS